MAVVSNVTIGSKRIDLEAFSGEVTQSELIQHTNTEHSREDGVTRTRRSTSYWNNFTVRHTQGTQHDVEVWQSIATVKRGQQVTLFWGVKT